MLFAVLLLFNLGGLSAQNFDLELQALSLKYHDHIQG